MRSSLQNELISPSKAAAMPTRWGEHDATLHRSPARSAARRHAFAVILGSTAIAGLRVLGIRWLLPTAAIVAPGRTGAARPRCWRLRRGPRYPAGTAAATRVPRVEGDLKLAAQERNALAHAAEAETGVQHLRIEPTAIVVDHHVQRAASSSTATRRRLSRARVR